MITVIKQRVYKASFTRGRTNVWPARYWATKPFRLHETCPTNRIFGPWGGGYLVYLSDGDVLFFRVSFSPIFSRTGYQKKANFLEQVVKTCQKRKFCYNGSFLSPIFVFLSILFTDFFQNRVSFEGKNSGAGRKFFFRGDIPVQI